MNLSSTVMRSMSVSAERLKEWPILGSRMRSRFHLTALASIVSPLWNSAPWRSLKVQVLRSLDGSHSVAMAGNDVHAGIEVEKPAGRAGHRLGDEVDEVAMGIETDGIVSGAETHRAAALWIALALSPGRRRVIPRGQRQQAPSSR